MKPLRLPTLLAIGMLTLGSDRALGQALERSTLVGIVTDASRTPIRSASIHISSPQLVGGERSAITDGDGSYRIAALPPGRYTVTAHADGFADETHRDIVLEIAATLPVDFELAIAALRNTVTVTEHTPLVDVRSSSSSTNFDQSFLDNVPTSRRLEDLVTLAPGVVANVAYGGSQGSNGLILDGVDLTEAEEGTPWLRFNYNWVDQVQVVALGANVEHGGFTGVVTTGTLKAGGNRFSGLGEYWTTKTGWVGTNTSEVAAALKQQFTPRFIETLWDGTLQLGGPIRHDRLWFFAGLEYYKREDRPAGFLGPGLTTQDDKHGIVKVTAALAPRVHVEGFFVGGKNYLTGVGAGPFTPMEATQIQSQPEQAWNGRLTWTPSDRTVFEFRHRGYTSPRSLDSSLPNGDAGPSPHYDEDTGFFSVNGASVERDDRRPRSIAATATHYATGALGLSHEVKLGFEFEHANSTTATGYPGGKLFEDADGQPYQVEIWSGWSAASTTNRSSVYAQDRWQVNERLTIDPGIRWDINRGSSRTVPNAFSTSPLALRLGAAWDIRTDHRMVLRAHVGRYYDALYGAQFELAGADNAPTITALVTGPDQFTEISRNPFKIAQTIDSGLSQSYMDEYVGGIERELFGKISLTGQMIRRNYRDMVGSLDRGAVYAPVQRLDPGPDGKVGTPDDGGLITAFDRISPIKSTITTNLPGAFRNYTAFQIVGRKRFADHWQMIASYSWSKTDGNFNNTFHSNARIQTALGAADPNTQINNTGSTAYDTPQELKVEGMYRIRQFGGFNLSAAYRLSSGYAWGRTIRVSNLSQGLEFVRIEPRGTRRLAKPNLLDLRMEKTLGVPKRTARIGLFVDVFNVLNQGGTDPTAFRPVIEISGPTFGFPGSWLDPRTARAALRVSF